MIGFMMLPNARLGDVDPASAVIALLALGAGLWAGYQAYEANRWQETDVGAGVVRLREIVVAKESAARRHLLGDTDRQINLEYSVQLAAPDLEKTGGRSGKLDKIYQDWTASVHERLVIVGPAGAGKTVAAVELAIALATDEEEGRLVPVRLPAAKWDPTRSFEEFAIDYLLNEFELSRSTAESLVKSRRILPIIDGLDEMEEVEELGYSSRVGVAVRELNRLQSGVAKTPLVVTCRAEHYDALRRVNLWIEDATEIAIEHVEPSEARAFISRRAARAERWEEVLRELETRPTGTLALALATPWKLTVATTVYEERTETGAFVRDPTELFAVATGGGEKATETEASTQDSVKALEFGVKQVNSHILSLFVPAAVHVQNQTARGHRRSPKKIGQSLAIIAEYLEKNRSEGRRLGGRSLPATDIALHEIWPLAGPRSPRVLNSAFVLLIGAAVAATGLFEIGIQEDAGNIVGFLGMVAVVLVCAAFQFSCWNAHPSRVRSVLASRRWASIASWLLFSVACSGFGALVSVAVLSAVGAKVEIAVLIIFFFVSAYFSANIFVPERGRSANPRTVVAGELVETFALVAPLAIAARLTSEAWSSFGITYWLGVLLFAAILSPVAVRYLSFVIACRLRSLPIPFRFAAMLAWCHSAGILRISGSSYQFRHLELQVHLASSGAIEHGRSARTRVRSRAHDSAQSTTPMS
ncbi:NACHT domain-containing protein [Actinomycetospora rhizophila]|uniref:NACHT domain-containing protein n=1 Tax=Actinomycetospora rhizophila TaxID=1416876 RepID=A0ABV9Z6Q8_9PSEU